MKPPTRPRSKPPRFSQQANAAGTEPTPPQPERRHRRVLRDWTPAQRQRLLNALKALGRTSADGSTPLDYTTLQTRLPKTPADEIQCMVEALQNKVLTHVSYGLRKENKEERRLIKPIELWVEQACRVTGALEEPILTAFSQMFTISSMEPGSQRSTHSTHVPLTSTDSPSRSPAGGRTGNFTATPHGSDSPGQQSGCAASPALVPTPRTPDPPHTPQSQTPMGGPLNQTTNSSRLRAHQARRCHNVDFSKIYSYLGGVDSENQDCCVLTAMESAVVLELLMCLPEEIHLLDGSELHHHFMEVYEVLSSPASSAESLKAERSTRPAAPSGGQTSHSSPAPTASQSDSTARHPDGQSDSTPHPHPEKNADTATSVESPSNRVGRGGATNSKGLDRDMMSSTTTPNCQSSSTQTESTNRGPSDWEKAGLCPLNPFHVPLKLLARHA